MPPFVIQQHKATKLHWDLRLEIGDVLKSWAVTKLPPKKVNLKRLAIKTPDHDKKYLTFEGKISEGSYGAGTVKIWDKGTYKLIDKKPKKIIIQLRGKKLTGKYALIKTTYAKNSWIFFRYD